MPDVYGSSINKKETCSPSNHQKGILSIFVKETN